MWSQSQTKKWSTKWVTDTILRQSFTSKMTNRKFPSLFLGQRDPLRRDPGHGAAVVAEVVDAPARILKVAAARPAAELAHVEGVLVAVVGDVRHVCPAAHDHAVPLGHGRLLRNNKWSVNTAEKSYGVVARGIRSLLHFHCPECIYCAHQNCL